MTRKRSEVAVQAEQPKEVPPTRESVSELPRGRGSVADMNWPSAQPAEETPIAPWYGRIIETQVVEHPFEEYQAIEASLRLGDARADYGSVIRELDEVETTVRRAFKLWLAVKLERARWELDNRVVFASMVETARDQLEREKAAATAQKLPSKMITDQDVLNRVALIFPDEYRHQELKRAAVKAAEDNMQNLVTTCESRCRTAAVKANKLR